MGIRLHILIRVLLLIAITGIGTTAFDVKQAGSIDESLFAPTSISVSGNKISVLEPFSNQVKVFSSSGLKEKEVVFQGEANALTQLDETTYLYCDLAKNEISAINLNLDNEYNFFEGVYKFVKPVDLFIDENNIYILELGIRAIITFDHNRVFKKIIPLQDDSGNLLEHVACFTYNKETKIFYVFSQNDSKVWMINTEGEIKGSFCSFGAAEGQVTRGGDILYSPSGAIFISDRYQNRIVVFSETGEFISHFSLKEMTGSDFNLPSGLAIDDDGLLYVASTEGANIQIFKVSSSMLQTESLMAQQLFPNLSDTVGLENTKLVALAETGVDAEIITGFDFQIFESEKFEEPLMQKDSTTPEKTLDTVSQQFSYTAEWILEQPLQADTYYDWRTRLRFKDSTGQWTNYVSFKTSSLPFEYSLKQNYPNPFNPSTNIAFTVPEEVHVKLEIFNLLGQKISTLNDEVVTAGNHTITWDGTSNNGRQVASGLYFYRLSAGDFVQSKKMVMIK